jgi:NAD(P)-dependent dehydrogenase (short-subunit alcohol dehydrogenase family)
MVELEGKVGIVTGGSTIIGRAVVRELHGLGAAVTVADVEPEGGEALADELGDSVVFGRAGITDDAQLQACVQATVERYGGAYAQHVVAWTNALLTPPPPHVLNLLGAATQDERVADRFVNGFDDPRDYQEWFMAPDRADSYLAELAAA